MADFLYMAKRQNLPNYRSVSWLENALVFTCRDAKTETHMQMC